MAERASLATVALLASTVMSEVVKGENFTVNLGRVLTRAWWWQMEM